MRVLICGGGVIGAAIAYFLSRRGAQAIVIERTEVACAASGKSGGFLALDWCDGTPLEPLARRSFALHARLAEEIGVDWGYRRARYLWRCRPSVGPAGSMTSTGSPIVLPFRCAWARRRRPHRFILHASLVP